MRHRIQVLLPIIAVFVVLIGGFAVANWPLGDAKPASPGEATPSASQASVTTATRPSASPTKAGTRTAPAATATASGAKLDGARRDLAQDEAAGGHTLERHVARTDPQLRERLDREPEISAASTYTDRATAERVVGLALQEHQAAVQRWARQAGDRQNLVIDYDAGEVIGRTIRQGERSARAVRSAVVVLRAAGANWYVLTSYPDD